MSMAKITITYQLKHLTKEDVTALLEMGYKKVDILKIDEAIPITIYQMVGGKKVFYRVARRRLGREEFLSGIGRSAFHGSALRTCTDGRMVSFDSGALFR